MYKSKPRAVGTEY